MKLTVENGTFAYPGGKEILKNISLTADAGDVVAILGPNGAGKTTLLRCVMGFLRWKSGESALDGKNIRSMNYRELWSNLAYVPQARNTVPMYTAEEMVLLGRSSRFGVFSQPARTDIDKVREIMDRLKITRLRTKKCSEISGGELQMVLIARAMAAEPKVLILDEPESNLDFRNQLLIMDTMSELASAGMTCVFNTHYPAHALQRASRALLLSGDGEHLFGDVHSVVTETNIERAFGVKAVIGEIEAPGSIVRDVLPLKVTDKTGELVADEENGRCIAVVSVIAGNYETAGKINALLHEYSDFIIGRMGMPYNGGETHIITATFDAPSSEIRTLVGRLSILPEVCVKATYAPAVSKEGTP